MSRDDVANTWSTSTPGPRFATFVAWILDDNTGARLTRSGIVRSETLSRSNPVDPNFGGTFDDPAIQFAVWSGIFEEPTPELALSVGDMLLMLSADWATAALTRARERDAREAEDARAEQINEWLDEVRKELMDDMIEAYEAMLEYFEEQRELEEDLSS